MDISCAIMGSVVPVKNVTGFTAAATAVANSKK
jgi:hypothetical protein